jgi:hypothetical protein
MATPQQKADAFGAAMGKLLLTNRALNGKISSDFLGANFTFSKDLQADVATVRKTDPASAAAMDAFFRDPAAQRAWLNKAASTEPPIKTSVDQTAGAAAGAVQDALTPSWASGLIGALTSGNTWLRVGEVVLGLLLVVAGVVKLVGPAALNASPVGRVAKALR